MSNEYTVGQVAKLWMGHQIRSWLGTWPMSEFPRVFGTGGTTSTGVSVSEWTALNYSAVWSAVALVSGDIASLPLVLYKRTKNGGKERHVDSKLYELLHDAPNPDMSSMVFREALQGHAMTWGNAYAEIERDAGNRPQNLWPVTPDRTTPFRQDRRLKYRITNTGTRGGDVIIEAANMLHVPGLGFDGTVGYSVINQARESISLGLATERFGGTFFGNGATFGGVLSHPGNLTTEVKQGIRESIDAMHTGVDRAHRFAIFGGGMKFEKTGIPPNDAQFLETRKFQVTEIARWFQIPPHKLGDLERATFSNIEQQDIEYYRSCLRRWLVRWEQELNRKLIAPLERKQQFFKHNAEGILRGDSAARAAFYGAMFNIGTYSINMILESEDLNPIGPEGDVHFVQGNLLPADLAMEGPAKPLPPKPVVKELPAPDDDEPDEEHKALRALLSEIAGNTAALMPSMAAEREVVAQAERDRHAAELEVVRAEAERLSQRLDEERAAAVEDRTAWRVEVDKVTAAQQVIDRERVYREDAEAALLAVRTAEAAVRVKADADTAAAAAALLAQRQAETERLTGMLTAHRALLVHVVGRVVRRETDRARRHQATPEKLRAWMEAFYVTHQDDCLEELGPAIRTHLAWKQSTEDVAVVTLALVTEHISESQRQLRAIVDGEPDEMHANLERMLQRWEHDRPNALADRILKEEVDYVRAYR